MWGRGVKMWTMHWHFRSSVIMMSHYHVIIMCHVLPRRQRMVITAGPLPRDIWRHLTFFTLLNILSVQQKTINMSGIICFVWLEWWSLFFCGKFGGATHGMTSSFVWSVANFCIYLAQIQSENKMHKKHFLWWYWGLTPVPPVVFIQTLWHSLPLCVGGEQ